MVAERSHIDEVGFFNEEIDGGLHEDYEWLLRAARIAEVVTVREPLVGIHWHDATITSTKRAADTISSWRYIMERTPELRSDRIALGRAYGQIAFVEATQGWRRRAWRSIGQGLRKNPLEPRLLMAMVVSARIVNGVTIVRLANRFGRGVL
jgi:hypothetical protein